MPFDCMHVYRTGRIYSGGLLRESKCEVNIKMCVWDTCASIKKNEKIMLAGMDAKASALRI